jgi:hypothetical protein
MGGQEEGRLGVVAEVVTQDAESPWRVAKGLGDGLGRMPLDIKSAEGLVLPLFGQGRFEEEAVGICYNKWCSDTHIITMTHTISSVKRGKGAPPVGGLALRRVRRKDWAKHEFEARQTGTRICSRDNITLTQ